MTTDPSNGGPAPASKTPYKQIKIPPPEHWVGMELAYQLPQNIANHMKDQARGLLPHVSSALFLLLVAVPILVLLTPNVVPGAVVRPLLVWVFVRIAFSLVGHYRRHDFQWRSLLASVVRPAVFWIGGLYLFNSMGHRQWALLPLAGLALWYLYQRPQRLFDFHREWLLVLPKVCGLVRQAVPPVRALPDRNHLLALAPILLVVPIFSVWLALLLFTGYVLFFTFKKSPHPDAPNSTLRRTASEMLALAADYPVDGPVAPGIWTPDTTRAHRAKWVFPPVAVTLLFLLYSLCFFMPWDLPFVQSEFRTDYRQLVYPILVGGDDPEYIAQILDDFPLDLTTTQRVADLHREWQAAQDDSLRKSELASQLEQAVEADESHDALVLQSGKTFLKQIPFGAHAVALAGALEGRWGYAVALVGSFLWVGALVPALFFVLFKQALIEQTLMKVNLLRSEARQPGSDWDGYVHRLSMSKHEAPDPTNRHRTIREADHLLVGTDPEQGFPILLHRDVLESHTYISGASGSGKTLRGVMPLVTQLLRGNVSPQGALQPMPPMVIIDLKGDPSLLSKVQEEAANRAQIEGRPLHDVFRFFTTVTGKPTNKFNPFSAFRSHGRSVIQFCQLVIDALQLNHGAGYGRSYFSKRNRDALLALLELRDFRSFQEIYEFTLTHECKRRFSDAQLHDAYELLSCIRALSHYEQLVTAPEQGADGKNVIHMDTLLERGQVAYFWLPASQESITVREIANLAVFALHSAMVYRVNEGLDYRKAYLVIDEFHKLAGETFSVILEQSRYTGLSAILANQTVAQLKTPSFDLRETVMANTNLKLYFGIHDMAEMMFFSKACGQEVSVFNSYSYAIQNTPQGRAESLTRTETETMQPKFSIDDIRAMSDDPEMVFMDMIGGRGYSQFGGQILPVRTFSPLPHLEPDQRPRSAWPRPNDIGSTEKDIPQRSSQENEEASRRELFETVLKLEGKWEQFIQDNPDFRA